MHVCGRVLVCDCASVCECALRVGMRKHGTTQQVRAADMQDWEDPGRGIAAWSAAAAAGVHCVLPTRPPPFSPSAAQPLPTHPLDSGPRYPGPSTEGGTHGQHRHSRQESTTQSLGHLLPQLPAKRLQVKVAAAPRASISPSTKWGEQECHPPQEALRAQTLPTLGAETMQALDKRSPGAPHPMTLTWLWAVSSCSPLEPPSKPYLEIGSLQL